MPVTYINNYPNVVIFSPKDPDSIVATYLLKDRYDNNLKNDLWQKNVQVYLEEKDPGGESIRDNYQKIESHVVAGQKTVVFLVNPIMDSVSILKLWNWCTDKGIDFVWLDNNIDNIELLKHLNIPGKQSSLKSTATLTYEFLNENQPVSKFFQIFDEGVVDKTEGTFSKEKEALPLYYFVASLGNTINDNQNDFLFQNLNKIIKEEEFLKQAIQVGKFVYNYAKIQQQKEQLLKTQSQQQVEEIIKDEKV